MSIGGTPHSRRYPGYAPSPPNPVPRDDPNQYDKIPPAPSAADFAPGDDSRLFLIRELPTAAWQFAALSTGAFLATQALRLFGVYAIHPLLIPVWALVTLLLTSWTYFSTRSAQQALTTGVLCLVALTVVVLGSQGPTTIVHRFLMVTAATVVIGIFVDQLGAHATEWRMRRLGVPEPLRLRWMDWWSHRFDPETLEAVPCDAQNQLGAYEARLRRELVVYQRRLLLLAVLVPLAFTESLLVIATLPLVTLALMIRDPESPPVIGLLFVLAKAGQGWLRYAADGDHVLGRWQSPAGDVLSRRLLVGAALLLSAFAFLPLRSYFQVLWGALHLSAPALWQLVLCLAVEPLLPLAIVGSAAVVTLGRILWSLELLCPHPTKDWSP